MNERQETEKNNKVISPDLRSLAQGCKAVFDNYRAIVCTQNVLFIKPSKALWEK